MSYHGIDIDIDIDISCFNIIFMSRLYTHTYKQNGWIINICGGRMLNE